MSTEAGDPQRRYREFLDLLPLTLALAGLPVSELGKNFNEDQIEVRVYTLRHAYRAARQFAREIVHTGSATGATS
jgi:hypothetical protein